MDFVQAISLITENSHPNFNAANQFLTERLNNQPEDFLNQLAAIIQNPELPLRLKKNTIQLSTVVARIKINKGVVESVSVPEISPESIENFVQALISQFSVPASNQEELDYGTSIATTMAHFRIAQFYLSPNRASQPHPALEFLPLINPSNPQNTIDNAVIAIDSIIDVLPVNHASVTENIVATILTYVLENETSLTLKHVFINIAGKLVKTLWSSMAKNTPFAVAFLNKLEELLPILPVEYFWFWSQVPLECYQMLSMNEGLANTMFEYLQSNQQEECLIYSMQFWLKVVSMEQKTQHLFDLGKANLNRVIDLALFIIQNDPSTVTYTRGDYTPVIAAMDTVNALIGAYYDKCFEILSPFVTENCNSENKSTKFAAAFLLSELIHCAKESSNDLTMLFEDSISDLVADDSPRVIAQTIKAISYAVSLEVIAMTEEIFNSVTSNAASEDSVMAMTSIKCLGIIGVRCQDSTDQVIEFLLNYVGGVENEMYVTSALNTLQDIIPKSSGQTKLNVFETIYQTLPAVAENRPDILDGFMSVINCCYSGLVKDEYQDILEISTRLFQICTEILESNACPTCINTIGLISYHCAEANPEFLQIAFQVINNFINKVELPECMMNSFSVAALLLRKLDNSEVLTSLAESAAIVLENPDVVADVYDKAASLVTIIAGLDRSVLAPYIESLFMSSQRILDLHSKKMTNILPIYELVHTLGFLIQVGSEEDVAIMQSLRTIVEMVGSEVNIPSVYRTFGVDALYMIYQHLPEMWHQIKMQQCVEFILAAGLKLNDQVSKDRTNELLNTR